MLKAFFSSATGMRAQELLIDNTANNLANVNTTGFKRSHVEFADIMYDVAKKPGAPTSDGQMAPIGLQIGSGVRTVGTSLLWNQGTAIQTNQPTHLAIEGDGFFKIAMPGGTFAYTRDGSFHIDATGRLVTSAGNVLEPAITIPPDAQDIQISKTGEVSVSSGNNTPSTIGVIQLVRFANRGGLEQLGGNLLRETPASGPELASPPGINGMGTLQQRALEGSNVEVVSEMVNLITAQRAYEINSRAIRAGDEMLSNTSQLWR